MKPLQTCQHCGNSYKQKNKTQKYCSHACRDWVKFAKACDKA